MAAPDWASSSGPLSRSIWHNNLCEKVVRVAPHSICRRCAVPARDSHRIESSSGPAGFRVQVNKRMIGSTGFVAAGRDGSPMAEQRRTTRRRVLKAAKIAFGGTGIIDCTVRNISDGGAWRPPVARDAGTDSVGGAGQAAGSEASGVRHRQGDRFTMSRTMVSARVEVPGAL
jgi:hypothetical protein